MLYTVHFTAFCLGGPFFSRTRCTLMSWYRWLCG